MIERKNHNLCSSERKLILGEGFVDILEGIGSYVSQNKDLIAKPLLSAVGNVGALAATEASKAIIRRLAQQPINKESAENETKLQNISSKYSNPPVGNIIGSGIKKF